MFFFRSETSLCVFCLSYIFIRYTFISFTLICTKRLYTSFFFLFHAFKVVYGLWGMVSYPSGCLLYILLHTHPKTYYAFMRHLCIYLYIYIYLISISVFLIASLLWSVCPCFMHIKEGSIWFLILDGCSVYYAHIWRKSGISICWGHLVASKE